jgi:hypothetical protein
MRIADQEFWMTNSIYVLRLLHLYETRDLVHLLDIFDRPVLDPNDNEPKLYKKCERVFFERIVGILPMYVKKMSNEQVVRSLEVCVN